MGWFWGIETKNDKDPTKSLDPSLKAFLDSQQPRPYVPAQAPSPPPQPQQISPAKSPSTSINTNTNIKAQTKAQTEAQIEAQTDDSPTPPIVPSESLFPDGRYAHLWSTYTPSQTLQTNSSTPLERIVTSHKDRREYLLRAALENCAFEHEIQQTCFTSGSAAQRAKARMTMCREETKAFNRCYGLQGKFLQALGYMGRRSSNSSNTGRSPRQNEATTTTKDIPEEIEDEDQDIQDEKIQMHADKLYHRMMDYETKVAAAQRNQTPIPPLSSVFNSSAPSPNLDQLLSSQPPSIRHRLQSTTTTTTTNTDNNPNSNNNDNSTTTTATSGHNNIPAQERELTIRAALQEVQQSTIFSQEVNEYAVVVERKRTERQKALSDMVGEPIGKFVIPDLKQNQKQKQKDDE